MTRDAALGVATGMLIVGVGAVVAAYPDAFLLKLAWPAPLPGVAALVYALTRPRPPAPDEVEAMRPPRYRFALGCLVGGALIALVVGGVGASLFSSWP